MTKKNGGTAVAEKVVEAPVAAVETPPVVVTTRRPRVDTAFILREHARAESLDDLSKRLNMPKTSLSARLVSIKKKMGINLKSFPKGASQKYTPEYVAELQKMYETACAEANNGSK